MFYEKDFTEIEHRMFYARACGYYEAITSMIEKKRKYLFEYEEENKIFPSDTAQEYIIFLRKTIEELEINKSLLENLYAGVLDH